MLEAILAIVVALFLMVGEAKISSSYDNNKTVHMYHHYDTNTTKTKDK